jgi:hypothetical protein
MRPGQEVAVVNQSEEVVFLGSAEGQDWPYREERIAKLRHEGGFEQVIELGLGTEFRDQFRLTLEDAGPWIPFLDEHVVRGAKLGCWKTWRDGVTVYVFVRENGLCWDVGTRKDFEAKGWGGLCNRADRDASG